MHLSKPKFIVLGSLAVLVVVLLLALVVPAMAASPKDGNRGTPGTSANQNGTVTQDNARGPMNGTLPGQKGTMVEGTATGTIIVTPTDSSAAVTLSMPAGAVMAFYRVSDTTYTLERLMVKMSQSTTGTPNTLPDQSGTKMEGIASGTITVTQTNGTVVTLSMPTDAVTAFYITSDTTYTLEQLMVKMAGQIPGMPGMGPNHNGHGQFGGFVS